MLGVTSTKNAFRQHLSHLGFLMDQPTQVVEQELRRHMGPERHARYEQIRAAGQPDGEEGQNRVYDFMQDLREANLLSSLSLNVTLDTSFHLYEKALPFLTRGKRVVELGCWTGGLSSFMADNHPECIVVGVDRVPRILQLNLAQYRMPNLSFVLWDYRAKKPESLEPADVLLCGLGTNHDCPPGAYTPHDPLTIRDLVGYEREKEEASRYFVHWRQAAKDDAYLFTVLRMPTVPRFLAFVDAAQEAGWTPLFKQFQAVPCPSSKERIPGLVFVARPSPQIEEDVALAHWTSLWMGNRRLTLRGAPAFSLYRALGQKQVLAQREGRSSAGYPAREEVGICGAWGYLFGQDARPEYMLALMSVAEAESQCQSFAQSPPPFPGVFTVTVG